MSFHSLQPAWSRGRGYFWRVWREMRLKVRSLGRTELFFSQKGMNRSHCVRSLSCPGFWALGGWALWSTRYNDQISAEDNIFSVWSFQSKTKCYQWFSPEKTSVFNLSSNAPAGKHPLSHSWIGMTEKSPYASGTGGRYGKTLPSLLRSTVILPVTKKKAVERRREGKGVSWG